jgi:hypothetical protein
LRTTKLFLNKVAKVGVLQKADIVTIMGGGWLVEMNLSRVISF